MDHALKDVTVAGFRDVLRDAAANVGRVEPSALREPLALWFLATKERATREGWTYLLGRDVVAVWDAAQAVLHADRPDTGAAQLHRPDGGGR